MCENISFNIYVYPGQRARIQLPNSATIDNLKLEIHKHCCISPSKQTIRGWSKVPENHDTPLKFWTRKNITDLLVINSEEEMDLEGNILNFFLVCKDNEKVLQLSEYYTVEVFKVKVHGLFGIPPHKQVIQGWKNIPESDCTILKACVDKSDDIIFLEISEVGTHFPCHFPNLDINSNDKVISEVVSHFPTMEINSNYAEAIKEVTSNNCPSMEVDSNTDEEIEKVGSHFPYHFPNLDVNSTSDCPIMEVASNTDEDLEVSASISVVCKMLKKNADCPVLFHICKLDDAIIESCLAPLEKRKSLLLYLHNETDPFTSLFCENLKKPEITEILNRNFFVVGWDVEETKYQSALVAALNQCISLSNLVNMVNTKVAAALCILPIENNLTVFSCLRGDIAYKDFLSTLTNAENFLITEIQEERTLEELKQKTGSKDDIGSENLQKLMADMLGDRDYDSFQFNQHEYLKKKIAFALLGREKDNMGYRAEEMRNVDSLFDTILKNSNEIAKYKDKVEISFIYNCTEPLPAEKLKRAKKYEEYNPQTDLMPHPVFVLRKCRGSADPCRVFIDHTGRTYDSWQNYKDKNKISQCVMILPRNGRYEVDENGDVLLDRCLSPDCGIDAKLLQGADVVSTVGGILSGGLLVTATMLPIAPPVLLAGGAVALGVGIYSIGRSAYVLLDRSRHKETLSFANSEARGAYLNIVAGSLGFVGVGANKAVAELTSRGVNIGKGARAFVNTIGIANIGVSGASVLNSGHDVFDQWYNEDQRPSLLSIVQLSSSVLFFGNAVYNFKTCSTIVEETQARTLREYQDSLRSNRHRKTFSKLLKETIHQNNGNEVRGKAEVISAIRNIQNKDEVFAVLTRSNKNMNKYGIKFSAVDGEIKLNGKNVDMNLFMSMDKQKAGTFLSNLPNREPTPVETSSMRNIIRDSLNTFSLPDIETLTNYAVRLLTFYNGDVKSKIIGALAQLLASCTEPIKIALDELFPNHTMYMNLIDMVVSFFRKSADDFEDQHKMWMTTHEDQYYNPLFEYIDTSKVNRYVQFFEMAVNFYYNGTHLTEKGLVELLKYFESWLTKQFFDYQERIDRNNLMREHSAASPTEKTPCSKCGGYYYIKKTKQKRKWGRQP